MVTEPEPLDTAGAARDVLRRRDDGPFLVCNGDILTDLDYAALVATHDAAGAVATLALTRVEETSTFGVVELHDDNRVRRFVEKPPPGTVEADTINAGTYVLSPEAFAGAPASGPLSFERAVFPGLVQAGATVVGVPSGAFWMDLGTPERYLAGHASVLRGECLWPLGDRFRRDGTTLIHRDAHIDSEAAIGNCVTVGAGATIENGATLDSAAVFEGAVVRSGAVVRNSIVGEHATIEPNTTVTDTVVPPAHGP